MTLEKEIVLSPVSGLNEHTVSVVGVESIDAGTELKHRVRAIFLGKELHLVAREITSDYLLKWKLLRNVGMPVIPLLRVTNQVFGTREASEHTMTAIVPDLTNDGSVLYGKEEAYEVFEGKYYLKQSDRELFLDVFFGDMNKIIRRINQYVQLASDNDIVLPEDGEGFKLLVHPNGSWELVMIDISLVRKRIEELETKSDVTETNVEIGDDFIGYLNKIANSLR